MDMKAKGHHRSTTTPSTFNTRSSCVVISSSQSSAEPHLVLLYLGPISAIRVLATRERAARVDARVLGCRVLAALSFRVPSRPLLEARRLTMSVLSVEAHRLFSSLRVPTLITNAYNHSPSPSSSAAATPATTTQRVIPIELLVPVRSHRPCCRCRSVHPGYNTPVGDCRRRGGPLIVEVGRGGGGRVGAEARHGGNGGCFGDYDLRVIIVSGRD